MDKENYNNKSGQMLREERCGQGGYVALVTAIVVTLIISLISIVTSNTSFLGRADTTRLESKALSRYAAEGCLDRARLRLAVDPNYSGNESVTIGTYNCSISTVAFVGDNKSVTATATVDNKTTKLELIFNPVTLGTLSLTEK